MLTFKEFVDANINSLAGKFLARFKHTSVRLRPRGTRQTKGFISEDNSLHCTKLTSWPPSSLKLKPLIWSFLENVNVDTHIIALLVMFYKLVCSTVDLYSFNQKKYKKDKIRMLVSVDV